jgi:hypothetical protein
MVDVGSREPAPDIRHPPSDILIPGEMVLAHHRVQQMAAAAVALAAGGRLSSGQND